MKKTITIDVAHQLGREEALRRARERAAQLKADYGHWLQATEEVWSDNVLCGEAAGALGQQISARRFAGSALQTE